MKNYRLKKWYPSLEKTIKIGSVVSKIYNCGGYNYRGSDSEGNVHYVGGGEVESNPDFWELIEEEKPLFITEDGVNVFEGDKYYVVTEIDFVKYPLIAKDIEYSDEAIRFKHESSADEYIWRNKRVFSYEDMMKAKHSIILADEDIEKAAKKRSEQ